MAEWFTRHADRFPLVFANAAEQTGIFHVVPEPGFAEAFEKTKEATQDYRSAVWMTLSSLLSSRLPSIPKWEKLSICWGRFI